jgi:LEA14-like dessication related protein
MRRAVLGFAVLAVLAGSGCASAFRQPEVRFEGVRVGSLGLRGGLLYAQVHIDNHNRYELHASSLTYDLELRAPTRDGEDEWVRVAEGRYEEPIRVAGGDAALIEIPVEFTFAGMEGVLRSVLDRGSVAYRVGGVVHVREPIRRNVPYRRAGVVAVR